MKEKKEKISYPVRQFRLNDKTFDNLKKLKKDLGKSWNLTFYEIIDFYLKNNKK